MMRLSPAAKAQRWVATIHVFDGNKQLCDVRIGESSLLVSFSLVPIVIALVFFFFMLSVASKSNDPVALMQTVGRVAGAVGGISLVMIIIGLIGKRV
jgi:hypothetical protein